MRRYLVAVICFLSFSAASSAQLPDGSKAPDFIANDIYGDAHHLEEYLNEGYSVILKFSATWCAICWNYHNSGVLTEVWEQYGPQGSDEAIILFIEGDIQTSVDCLSGNCQGTQGNWTMMTPYPIINDHLLNDPYGISAFPTVIGIHPDGKTKNLGQADATELGNFIIAGRYNGYASDITPVSCPGAEDGSIRITMDEAESTFSYLWSNGSKDSAVTNLSPGIYRATITDGNGGVIVTEDFLITEPGPMMIFETGLQHINCKSPVGSAAVEATGGNGGYEYLWSTGQNGNQLIAFNSGSYHVTVTDSLGCQANSEIVIMKNTDLPEIDAGTDQEVKCNIEWPLELRSSSDNPYLIYHWVHEDGSLVTDADHPAVWVERTGVFRITVRDTLTGCVNFDEVAVTYEPVTRSIEYTDVACFGTENGWIEISFFTDIPYEINWSNGQAGNRIENLSSGYYTAQASVGECRTIDVVEISEPATPLKVTIDTLTISGHTEGLIEVTVTGGWGDYHTEWYFEEVLIAQDIFFMEVSESGKYEVVITDSGGCEERVTVNMHLAATSITFGEARNFIQIYPNPAGDFIIMEGVEPNAISRIEILDYAGRKAMAFPEIGSAPLDIKSLKNSLYIMKIDFTDGSSKVVKFKKL